MIALVKWHEKELGNIRKEMDGLFSRCFRRFEDVPQGIGEWKPCLDLLEVQDELVVRAELPGLDTNDLDISVHGRLLTIRGHKRREECHEGENYRCMERTYGSFTRSLELPFVVDTNKVNAVYKNGVLTISMPKLKKELPHTMIIEVK